MAWVRKRASARQKAELDAALAAEEARRVAEQSALDQAARVRAETEVLRGKASDTLWEAVLEADEAGRAKVYYEHPDLAARFADRYPPVGVYDPRVEIGVEQVKDAVNAASGPVGAVAEWFEDLGRSLSGSETERRRRLDEAIEARTKELLPAFGNNEELARAVAEKQVLGSPLDDAQTVMGNVTDAGVDASLEAARDKAFGALDEAALKNDPPEGKI